MQNNYSEYEDPEYYLRFQNKSWFGKILKRWLEEKKPLLGIIRNFVGGKRGRLLDIGCGPGLFLKHAQDYFETYGIDISKWAIKEARINTPKSRLYCGDALVEIKKFPKDNFLVITAFDFLEHMGYPHYLIRHVFKILSAEGIFVLSVPNLSSLGRKIKEQNWVGFREETHQSILEKSSWINLLEKNNFDILKVTYDYLWDVPYFCRRCQWLEILFLKASTYLLNLLGINVIPWLGENLIIIAKKN